MAVQAIEKKPASKLKRVAFVVKNLEAASVALTGEFTGWSDEGVALAKGPDGLWSTTLNLAPGEYQYRLRVDGGWRDDPGSARRVPNPFGSENCVLVVK